MMSLFFSLLLSTTNTWAVPLQITQQGRIKDSVGGEIQGAHIVVFRIYDQEVGGNILWDETLTVQFTNGYYATILGSDVSNNPLDSQTLGLYPLYLEIQLDTNTPMSPRQAINSAPYAQISGVAESVDGGTVNASEVQINSVPVVDGNRNWVGEPITVDWSSIQNIPNDIADGDTNTQLSEQDVENYVTNDGISLHQDTTLNGQQILTMGMTTDTLGNLNCQSGQIAKSDGNTWACSDDLDSNIDSGTVLGYVEQNPVDLSTGSTVNGQNILTQPTGCTGGQILVYDTSTMGWNCGDDTDTTLTPSEMQVAVEAMTLNLQNLPQVNSVDVLTANSPLNPSNVDVSSSTSGQVLTSDGSTASWQDAGNGSGCSVVETIRGYPVRMRLECGSDTYIVNGSTLNSKSLSKPNEWTSSFHCAIDISENPVCWGDDSYGQISDVPTNVLFTSLSTGQNHNCGLDTSGQVHCWGYDGNSQVSGAPSGTYTQIVSGLETTCALDGNGSITCWGRNDFGQSNPPNGTFTELYEGEYFMCGLNTSQQLSCWGRDHYNQASVLPPLPFTYVSLANEHACAIDTSSTLHCWGRDDYGQSTPPSGTFSAVEASTYHTCAVRTSGEVVCFGYDGYGVISNTPTSGTYTKLVSGDAHFCGLQTNGNVDCWGYQPNYAGTPDGGNFIDIESNLNSTCGILDSGNVICWGQSSANQTSPP